jgi:pimeloyl-ACP methyl ester carboxylesterase
MSFRLTAVASTLILAACAASDLGPQAATLWTPATSVILGGTSTAEVTVVMARNSVVSYAVYGSAQTGLTAEQIRDEAHGSGAGTSSQAGTHAVTPDQVGDPVRFRITGLTPGNSYQIYLAAEPVVADPAPTDLDLVKSGAVTLHAVQPAVSYTSVAVPGTIGYYAYAPEDHYYRPTQKFPLLIFLHGSGEKGNGTTDLSRVLIHGPPKLINGGREFPFVVISPQLPTTEGGWSVGLVDELIARAKADFPVDTTRIYLTGLSMGGYGTWSYALSRPNVVAAVVPIAGAGNPGAACTMKNVPTWAFHGEADGTVSDSGSIQMVRAINNCSPAPSVAAKITLYPGVGHDSWTRTYDGSAGHDIYTWLLQYHR